MNVFKDPKNMKSNRLRKIDSDIKSMEKYAQTLAVRLDDESVSELGRKTIHMCLAKCQKNLKKMNKTRNQIISEISQDTKHRNRIVRESYEAVRCR